MSDRKPKVTVLHCCPWCHTEAFWQRFCVEPSDKYFIRSHQTVSHFQPLFSSFYSASPCGQLAQFAGAIQPCSLLAFQLMWFYLSSTFGTVLTSYHFIPLCANNGGDMKRWLEASQRAPPGTSYRPSNNVWRFLKWKRWVSAVCGAFYWSPSLASCVKMRTGAAQKNSAVRCLVVYVAHGCFSMQSDTHRHTHTPVIFTAHANSSSFFASSEEHDR